MSDHVIPSAEDPVQLPREALIQFGPEHLKNFELVAIVLGRGTRKESVFDMARRVIRDYGEQALATEHHVRRLQNYLHLGPVHACQLVACFELGRRFFERGRSTQTVLRSAKETYEYLKGMQDLNKEQLRGLYLNARNQVIRDEVISLGSLTSNVVHPREVMKPAIECSAAAIILAHNHPSGDPEPSDADLEITQQLVQAGNIMNIQVLDHLIIGQASYMSFQEKGML